MLLSAYPGAMTVTAQQVSQSRAGISIVLSADSNLRRGAAVLVRVSRANAGDNQILLDERKATPDDLANAIELVRQIRAHYGDSLPGDIEAIPVQRKDLMSPTSPLFRETMAQLALLKRAAPARVRGGLERRRVLLSVHAEPIEKKWWPDTSSRTPHQPASL